MIFIWVILVSCLFLRVDSLQAQLPPETVPGKVITSSVKETAGKNASVEWQSVPLPADFPEKWRNLLPKDGKQIFVGKIEGEHSLEVLIARSKGKVEYFIFAVYFDPQKMEIWDVDVLDYREAYGGEIDYKAFRRQFKGKQHPREIVFRRTIRNISGATISARSITRKVKEILAMYHYLKENGGTFNDQ